MEKEIEIKLLEGMGKGFEERIIIIMHNRYSHNYNNY